MRIAALSKRLNISSYTLRYYEKIGIIQNIKRDGNGQREFTENDVKWLEFVVRLKRMQMPIEKMKRYAELRYKGNSTIYERCDVLVSHKNALLDKVKELNESIAFLDKKIEIYNKMKGDKHEQRKI